MLLSIIIPAINESASIHNILTPLQELRSKKLIEVIVVDGGSDDDTIKKAALLADKVISSRKGRALQMNAGAELAVGDMLLFLHADTSLPSDIYSEIKKIFVGKYSFWGFSPVFLSGSNWLFRVIERSINIRSRMTSVATGDQALFVSRSLFESVGQFPELRLMEDVAISKALRKIKPPCVLNSYVKTSSRRWEENGIIKTIGLMWILRLQYFLGVSSEKLAKKYYPNN
ncbi:MAG: TIGR04283 family arsenosugar biosynthesis glycosyltransferase [Cellvibrionaceae bacterium]